MRHVVFVSLDYLRGGSEPVSVSSFLTLGSSEGEKVQLKLQKCNRILYRQKVNPNKRPEITFFIRNLERLYRVSFLF